ncbi:MAG: M55 family metallopeptidase [bacterium]|nr:M55 family metallopeptidase [bacterium]
MKIFIAVDMEGATGIVHHDQLMPGGGGYAAGCSLMTGDVNAAIRGALRADPEATFTVGDGHGVMRNIILEDLHERAELVIGPGKPANKPLVQLEGIDDSYAMAFMVGYHSKAGTPNGLLAHTYIGSLVCNWRLNGRTVGEIEMNAAVLSSFDVPVALITGNSDLESELRDLNLPLEWVSTKRSLGTTAAVCLPPSRTATLIEDAAERAVQKSADKRLIWKPRDAHKRAEERRTPKECVIEVEMYRREQAERASSAQGITLVNDRTVSCTADTPAEAFRTMWRACTRALDEAPTWLT